MAKWTNDALLDTALQYIRNNVKKICVLTAQPTLLSECSAATVLAVTTVNTAMTIQDGVVSGRRITIPICATVAVATTGVATHVALYSTVGGSSGLHYVTQCSTQALTSTSNQVTIPAWNIEIADPS
jgi:hypothetical protein